MTLRVSLERRPGLLVWRIDDAVVHVVTGRVDSFDRGVHQDGPMMLIVNTAVGGPFAGDAEIGRQGAWLGEALVPASYPSELRDTLAVDDITVRHH